MGLLTWNKPVMAKRSSNRATNNINKVHGANTGPIWGRQEPGGPHVGTMNLAIWDSMVDKNVSMNDNNGSMANNDTMDIFFYITYYLASKILNTAVRL